MHALLDKQFQYSALNFVGSTVIYIYVLTIEILFIFALLDG